MDILERIIREATAKSSDGRIDIDDFLNHCASATRYSLFTPMEASIIFHFAGSGTKKRLSLLDFAALLDPKWRPTGRVTGGLGVGTGQTTTQTATGGQVAGHKSSVLNEIGHSIYNFALGGIAGCTGATAVYPIDLGAYLISSLPPLACGVDAFLY